MGQIFSLPRKFAALAFKGFSQFEWLGPAPRWQPSFDTVSNSIQLRRVMDDGHSSMNIIHWGFVRSTLNAKMMDGGNAF